MMMTLGWILAGVALAAIVIAAYGIIKLPDALSRQHAATKAATLGLSLFSLALMAVAVAADWGGGWVLRLLVLLVFLLLTLPLASHALARAAISETRDTDGRSQLGD